MSLTNFRIIFFSAIIATGVSPIFVRLTLMLGFVDKPGTEPHKKHANNIPLAGGLVIFFTLFLFMWMNGLIANREIRAIFISGIIVFAFGLWDDRVLLSPPVKLVGQLAGAITLIGFGVHVKLFSNPVPDNIITILWIVGVTNAFNFVDSMDGLASGLAAITTGFFVLVAFDSGQMTLSSFSAALLGACGVVYFFTAMPAYLFLGDSGAQFLGFVLGAVAIAYNPVGFLPTQSWYIPVMLVGVPLFDTALVVFSRIRRRKPIYQSGLDHTYHRLVAFGMHPNRAVATMHFTAVMLGCLAFITISQPPLIANSIFLSLIFISMVCVLLFELKFGYRGPGS